VGRVHVQNDSPASASSSRLYSCHRAATPPAPLMSVTEGIISKSTPLAVSLGPGPGESDRAAAARERGAIGAGRRVECVGRAPVDAAGSHGWYCPIGIGDA